MDVLIVLVFVSLVLVAGSIVLFVFTMRQRDFEHGERLSILPLLDPTGPPGAMEEPADAPDSSESHRS
jgi:hypothetical protein